MKFRLHVDLTRRNVNGTKRRVRHRHGGEERKLRGRARKHYVRVSKAMKARMEGDERGAMGPFWDAMPQLLNHIEGRHKVKVDAIRKDLGESVESIIR